MKCTTAAENSNPVPVKPTNFYAEKTQSYVYLKTSLTIEDENSSELNGNQYKFLILQAMKETLGQVGAATPVDLLKVFGDGTCIIRVPSRSTEKIWAALTLYGSTPSGKRCAFRVIHASPFLLGLAFNSRNHRDATS
ncbi:ribonuclease p protein subunit p14 [Plakobranchus ocellatus]|uniref:Ribonuclease p protein subunit p14 n=1 Tax=Plakobranchus ocellatus TaxID=259542 RepID=A0AAV4D2L9_9GAST|nr:ribonuclease p protein subunit p14 [Plakobranchus ocellatus]